MRIKDVQIAEKDKQLDQQQQLTAKAMADKETLKLELEEAKAEADQVRLQAEEIQSEMGPKKVFKSFIW